MAKRESQPDMLASGICCYCGAVVVSKTAPYEKAKRWLERIKRRCKKHPQVPLIRHYRRADLSPPTRPEPTGSAARFHPA